jgi:predicted Rossmann fold nucleotide-binding protein DprA/Smf involved in DNA uptake
MTVSENTQAILLLTAHFKKAESGAAKPLTPKEWGRFAEWLRQRSLTPEHFLRGDLKDLLDGWHDKTVSVERVNALLDRGPGLAISMEKWLRSGLWVMTRSDPDYPRRLKQRLWGDSPAVLFGCGNRVLAKYRKHLLDNNLALVSRRSILKRDSTRATPCSETSTSTALRIQHLRSIRAKTVARGAARTKI